MSMIEELKERQKHDLLYNLGGCYSDLKEDLFDMINSELKKENGAIKNQYSKVYEFRDDDFEVMKEQYYDCRIKAKKILEAILNYCEKDAKKAYDHIDELYCLFRGAANE